jgi:redox-sensitive bicupin YhaK (pirin superfamily)
MIEIHPADARGASSRSWLESRHSFSFGAYFDPEHVQFGPLRVINDDRIKGGGGFQPHSHADMEIVTFMISGTLAHEDSTGARETIGADEVQRMTAGTGITHSEFNASPEAEAHLLQIWLLPATKGLTPGYEQKTFPRADRRNRLLVLVSGSGVGGALKIHQDVEIHAVVLDGGGVVTHALAPDRRAWVQVARGEVTLNGELLAEGDGAAITGETLLTLASAPGGGEVLLFDLP